LKACTPATVKATVYVSCLCGENAAPTSLFATRSIGAKGPVECDGFGACGAAFIDDILGVKFMKAMHANSKIAV
jgi:hypothetical protein